MNITELAIDREIKQDRGYAHVLLHTVAHIYFHTPWPKRKEALEPWRERWPQLVKDCLKQCSQTGRKEVK
jgi:hypothetical protein